MSHFSSCSFHWTMSGLPLTVWVVEKFVLSERKKKTTDKQAHFHIYSCYGMLNISTGYKGKFTMSWGNWWMSQLSRSSQKSLENQKPPWLRFFFSDTTQFSSEHIKKPVVRNWDFFVCLLSTDHRFVVMVLVVSKLLEFGTKFHHLQNENIIMY